MRGRIREKDLYHFQVEHLKYEELYQTLEELREAEERGEGKINWNVWNELVFQTKEQITKALEQKPTRTKRKPIPTEGKKT